MNQPLIPHAEGAAPARFTADEFLRMVELGAFDDMKVELDQGEIIRMSPTYSRHGAMLARLTLLLGRYGADRLFVDTLLRLGPHSVRAFDIAVTWLEAAPGDVLQPSDILLGVEIADASLERDLGSKGRDYASAGIPTYWVVDVNARAVHVMTRPAGAVYADRSVARFGEVLVLPENDDTITLD